jgi:hypothetical protein
MLIQYRKRIAKDHQVVTVGDPLLLRREAVGTQKAAAILDRFFVNRSGGAPNAPRVVLNYYF